MTYTEELRRLQRAQLLGQVSATDRLIRQIYVRAAGRLERQAAGAKEGSLTKRWREDYARSVRREIARMNAEIEDAITAGLDRAARIRADGAGEYLERALDAAGYRLSDSFSDVLSHCRTDALEALIGGKMYSDGRILSRRIWSATGRLQGGIEEILAQGVAQQQSTYQIARALESYVNPKAACPVDWRKLYPDTPFEMKVDYNATRLARTAMNHVYWQTGINAAKENPFCKAMHWELSDAHYERQVAHWGEDVCDEYARHDEGLGRGNFPIDKLPRPHPNCLCIQWEVLPEPEEAAERFKAWMNGAEDPALETGFGKWVRTADGQKTAESIFLSAKDRMPSSKNVDKSGEDGTIDVRNVDIPRSLGAKTLNYDILLPDGEYTQLTEGTRITNVAIIAGKGRERQIDEIDNLLARYGGTAQEWTKRKGIGYVDYDGESYKAELHWYEEPSVGRVKFKIKTKNGEWFLDE